MSDILSKRDTLFLPEEERILDKTLSIREKILDEIIKDGIPTDSRTIRVINEVMSAMDSQILGRIDRRLKKDENNNTEAMVELVSKVLDNIHAEKVNSQRNNPPVIEGELDDREIVLDETTIGLVEIDADEILKENK